MVSWLSLVVLVKPLCTGQRGDGRIRGSAAGRPLINAVGKPKVVINGTRLNYFAEFFMAGNPLTGGGFVILNAITFDEEGHIVEMATPYPGSNLFSLASGGALYIRDPNNVDQQRSTQRRTF